MPAVQILRQVWLQQFLRIQDDDDPGVTWRTAEDLPQAARLISSPYDDEARYGKKRSTEWTGYKVHLTETCDPDTPNLITDVQTTPATTSDRVMTAVIQDHLAKRNLLPATHLVDVGYASAEHLVTSQTKHHIDLVAPAPPDPSWQAKAQQGFDIRQFSIDWDAQTVTCPTRHTSAWWIPGKDHLDLDVIDVSFARADC